MKHRRLKVTPRLSSATVVDTEETKEAAASVQGRLGGLGLALPPTQAALGTVGC